MSDPSLISYRINDHRSWTATQTRRLLEPLLARFGITRVGDITGLDQMGVFVSSVTRPRSETIVLFSGKGPTKDQSYVSGVMEAIEGYCAEPKNFEGTLVTASWEEIDNNQSGLDPRCLILSVDSTFDPTHNLRWVRGLDVTKNTVVHVPEDVVFIPTQNRPPLVSGTTNGLCAGSNFAEAVLHGIYEVIERDSCSLAEVFESVSPVALDSGLSLELAAPLANAKKLGLSLRLYLCDTDISIPTFFCVIEDESRGDPCFFNIGHGTHLDVNIAISRAVSEAAQSRLLYIAGAREDLWDSHRTIMPRPEYDALLNERGFGFLTQDSRPVFTIDQMYRKCSSPHFNTLEEEIDECVRRLRCVGLDRIVVVDLTPPLVPFTVLRVLIPGLECYYSDQTRIGNRIKTRLSGRANARQV